MSAASPPTPSRPGLDEVIVYPGSLAELEADLARGMAPLLPSDLAGLEAREFGGRLYIGTHAALRHRCPFLFPFDGSATRSWNTPSNAFR